MFKESRNPKIGTLHLQQIWAIKINYSYIYFETKWTPFFKACICKLLRTHVYAKCCFDL